MFQGTQEQLNLYQFSLKGDVDGEGRGVSRYDEQEKYKENCWNMRTQEIFGREKGPPS